MRRLLYNSKGLLQEKFVLVEVPGTLYAGFKWTLEVLQHQSQADEKLAFVEQISSLDKKASPQVTLPKYASDPAFNFQLDPIRNAEKSSDKSPLLLNPKELASDPIKLDAFIQHLCKESTLDHGQATALCQSLCRDMALTQGPPGTGKT